MHTLIRALWLAAAPIGIALAQPDPTPAEAPLVEPVPTPPVEVAPVEPTSAAPAEAPVDESPRIVPGPDRVFIDRVTAAEGGLTGLDHLATATLGPLGTVRMRIGLTHFEALDFPIDGATNSFTATDFSLSTTPLSFAELALAVRATTNANDGARPTVMQSVGDATFGLKLGWTFFEALSVAATAEARVVGLVGGGGVAGDATSYRARGIITGDFHRGFDIPARVTLSLGYDSENREALFTDELQQPGVITEWGLQAYRYDRVMAAVALEVPVHRFGGVFVEYHLGTPLQVELTRRGPGSDDFTFAAVPHWITPGLRTFPVPELAVDFALRYGLADDVYTGVPATPPWMLSLALTYTLDPRPEVTEREVVREVMPPPPTTVAGTVVDEVTRAPIAGAIVEFGPGLSPQVTGPDGRFTGYRLDGAATLTLAARAEGYRPTGTTVEVAAGGEVQVPFGLTAAPPPAPGSIEVRAVDAAGAPQEARVRVMAADGPAGRAESSRPFRAELPPGRYVVAVRAEGRAPAEKAVDVAPGQTSTVEVTLDAAEGAPKAAAKAPRAAPKARKPAAEAPEAGAGRRRPGGSRGPRGGYPTLRFAAGAATLDAAAKAALDGVAARLKRSPDVRLRIAAHTDDRGSKAAQDRLGNDRARAVKAYLVGKGIEGRRLSARGYGATKPVAPNLTASGRARNNRVELRVLGGK